MYLKKKGFIIKEIYSHKLKNAQKLANKLNAKATNNLNSLTKTDLTIICVSDDIIKKIITMIDDRPIVHTSGNTTIDVFENKFSNYGVLYPLQSFNKNIPVNFSEIPIIYESNNLSFKKKIKKLAKDISNNIIELNSKQRKSIHISAVFASNFTNHMYNIAANILKQENLNFSLLLPLVKQGISRLENNHPKDVQTGPAKRKDYDTIQEHIQMLDNSSIKKIYQNVTEEIIKTYQ